MGLEWKRVGGGRKAEVEIDGETYIVFLAWQEWKAYAGADQTVVPQGGELLDRAARLAVKDDSYAGWDRGVQRPVQADHLRAAEIETG